MHRPPVLNLLYISIQHSTRRHNRQRSWLPVKTSTGINALLRLPPCLYLCRRAGLVWHIALFIRSGRVGRIVGDERPEFGQDVPELVDGGQLLDVGLEERFGGGIVEGFDIGLNVAADALKRGYEAVKKEISYAFFASLFVRLLQVAVRCHFRAMVQAKNCDTYSSILCKVAAAETGSSS